MFNGKYLHIIGGTCSFGNAVFERFLDTNIAEIRTLNRDEIKQDDKLRRHKHSSSTPLVCPHDLLQPLGLVYRNLLATIRK